MIKLSNNFNIVTMIKSKCNIDITILDEEKNQFTSGGRNYISAKYKVSATIKNKQTNKLLTVEEVSFQEIDEVLKDGILRQEDELSVKRTDIRLNFSPEEHVLMSVLGDASFYQRYKNNFQFEREVIKNLESEKVFIELNRLKSYYDFITHIVINR